MFYTSCHRTASECLPQRGLQTCFSTRANLGAPGLTCVTGVLLEASLQLWLVKQRSCRSLKVRVVLVWHSSSHPECPSKGFQQCRLSEMLLLIQEGWLAVTQPYAHFRFVLWELCQGLMKSLFQLFQHCGILIGEILVAYYGKHSFVFKQKWQVLDLFLMRFSALMHFSSSWDLVWQVVGVKLNFYLPILAQLKATYFPLRVRDLKLTLQ